MRHLKLVLILLLGLFSAACSDGSGPLIGSPLGPVGEQFGNVLLRFELDPRVPSFVDTIEVTGFDANGVQAFPVETGEAAREEVSARGFSFPKVPEKLLENVSTRVVRFEFRYFSNGVLVGTGSVEVVVPAGGTVTIIDPPFVSVIEPTRIEISPTSASVQVGQSQVFIVTAFLPDGSSFNAVDQSLFQVVDPGIASVDAAGTATGLAPGQTQVIATLDSLTASADLTVTATPSGNVVSIEVFPNSVYAPFNTGRQFDAILTHLDGTKTRGNNLVTWSLSDNALGNINTTGFLTTLTTPGSGTVTASTNGVNGNCQLFVGPTLLTVAQQQSQSLASFAFNNNNLAHLGNLTLPGLPRTHDLSRNNRDIFVALNQTGIQHCLLDPTTGLYQTGSLLSNANLSSINSIFVHPGGHHVYCWDNLNRRFISILFNSQTQAMTVESIISLNTTNSFGNRLSGLKVGDETFVHFKDNTFNSICQVPVDNLDKPLYDLSNITPTFVATDDTDDVIFRCNAAPINFTNLSQVACSDNNVFAAQQNGQFFAFNVLQGGLLNQAGAPLALTNTSFPTGFISGPSGLVIPTTVFRIPLEFMVILSFQNGGLISLFEVPLSSEFIFDYAANGTNFFTIGSTVSGVRLSGFNTNSTLVPFNGILIDPAPCSQRMTH
ncbi:MAG: hypothetical protein AMXMBFR33_29790 [Candidatus Xenobia bacterium]